MGIFDIKKTEHSYQLFYKDEMLFTVSLETRNPMVLMSNKIKFTEHDNIYNIGVLPVKNLEEALEIAKFYIDKQRLFFTYEN
jgi:hypothetical protein